MDKLSIIIPSNVCPYAMKTIRDLLEKSVEEVEILVNIDADMPDDLVKDKRVEYTHPDKPIGMRGGINLGLLKATGKYVMKVDDHCLFAKGYDKVLKENMEDNWLVIPRRYPLHAAEWRIDERMPVKDYHYLSYPGLDSFYGVGLYPQEWRERTFERLHKSEYDIDDTMTFQGSCWFVNREYFMKHVGILDDNPETYSTFSGEALETGLKYWLGGGEVKVNKKTWYAHLFKNANYYKDKTNERGYKKELRNLTGHGWAARHWMRNEEPNMIHPFTWLLEKFWPVPTWPEDRKLWTV